MGINLQSNEEIKAETNFHWSMYIGSGLWGVLCLVMSIAAGIGATQTTGNFSMVALFLTLGVAPNLYKFLVNKTKHYVVTSNRVYVEHGILAKMKKEIPLAKINDVTVTQGILQRMFGSGNIVILTGNDNPLIIKDIDKPEDFKDAISRAGWEQTSCLKSNPSGPSRYIQ